MYDALTELVIKNLSIFNAGNFIEIIFCDIVFVLGNQFTLVHFTSITDPLVSHHTLKSVPVFEFKTIGIYPCAEEKEQVLRF